MFPRRNELIIIKPEYDMTKFDGKSKTDMIKYTYENDGYIPNTISSLNPVFTYFDLYTLKKVYTGEPFSINDEDSIIDVVAKIQKYRLDWDKIKDKPARWNYIYDDKLELYQKYCSIASDIHPYTLKECVLTLLLTMPKDEIGIDLVHELL